MSEEEHDDNKLVVFPTRGIGRREVLRGTVKGVVGLNLGLAFAAEMWR